MVDNHRACIGGLDLCFGRWDTNTHPLAVSPEHYESDWDSCLTIRQDVHPTNFAAALFPGQDYNNARVLDFKVGL